MKNKKLLENFSINGMPIFVGYENEKFDEDVLGKAGFSSYVIDGLADAYFRGDDKERRNIEGLCECARNGELNSDIVKKIERSYDSIKRANRNFRDDVERGRKKGFSA